MTQDEALALARTVAEREGWPFLEPISVKYRKRWFTKGGTWTIHTHVSAMVAHVGVIIDDATGAVLDKRYVNFPR